MMPEGKRKSLTLYLAAAAILTCYLVQVTDCYRLTKTERREGRKVADAGKTTGLQDGRIVFGRAFEKGSQVIDGTKKSSNASVEDESTYQADSAGWSKGQTTNAAEALWKRMNPSLQCGGDQMKFKAMGPGSSLFTVEQASAPALPLTQIPTTCGYNMQRNALGFVMSAPYTGCNMVQEGGSYVLPLQWQGIPVSLWCPKPAAQPTSAAPTTAAKHPEMPIFPPYPLYPPFYPPFYPPPVTPAPATTAAKPQMPIFPQYPLYPPFYPLPVTPAPATTAAKPQIPIFPPYPIYPPFYPLPVTPAPATTAAKPQIPIFPPYPIYPPFYPLPVTPAPATTAAKPQIPKFPPYPIYPPFYHLPVTPAPATTTKAPPKVVPVPPFPWPLPVDPRFPPYVFPPFPFPPYHQPPTTAPPTTKKPDVPTTQHPDDHTHRHGHYPIPYPYPLIPYAKS